MVDPNTGLDEADIAMLEQLGALEQSGALRQVVALPGPPTAEEIFAEFYNPNEQWDPVDAIARALNISTEEANARTGPIEKLWDDLLNIWVDHTDPAATGGGTDPTTRSARGTLLSDTGSEPPPQRPRWGQEDFPGEDELKVPELPELPGDATEAAAQPPVPPGPVDIEMQELGGPDPVSSGLGDDDPTSIYSGDSGKQEITPYEPEPEPTPSEGGRAVRPGDIEMQDLNPRGPPSLHPELDADGRGPLAGGTDEASPVLIGDMPEAGAAFDLGAVDWTMVKRPTVEALAEYITGDAGQDGAFLGSDGIGQNLGMFSRVGFANFLQSRIMDMGVGELLMPLFQWIDDATGTPWVSRGIQGAMALAGAAMGDPFGVIAAPFLWSAQELQKQSMRKHYDKRYGFVREGDKWYPAYLTRSERDEGWIGSDRTQIRLSYGKDLKFKHQKGTGKMIPYFDEGSYRQKDFHVWDNELDTTDKQSSKQWRDQSDPLRDFYFMSEDETTDFLGKLGGGDTVTKYADDRDHAFTAEEQDAIKAAQASAFDMMQVHDDVSWGETWDTYGTDEQKEYREIRAVRANSARHALRHGVVARLPHERAGEHLHHTHG